MIINWYGFFIFLGILAGSLAIEKYRKKIASPASCTSLSVYDILPWVLIPGIIGARLYHVLDYWQYYAKEPISMLLIWQGGLGIFGALIGGCFGLLTYSAIASWREFKKEKLRNYAPLSKAEIKKLRNFFPQYLNVLISNFLAIADLSAIGLAIGQAIGRWGNFFNQELYGYPTNLAWGIYIRPENRLAGFENFSYFHPLFLYESLGCLIIFLVLLVLNRRLKSATTRKRLDRRLKSATTGKRMDRRLKSANTNGGSRAGVIFFVYLFLYGFLRFWLEFLRIEGWEVRGLRVNQLTALFFVLVSLVALFREDGRIDTCQ